MANITVYDKMNDKNWQKAENNMTNVKVWWLSAEVVCPHRRLGHYTLPDKNIGKQIPREKKIIE